MIEEIKERIRKIADNMNGNHNRSIKELEEAKKDITEVQDNLRDKRKHQKQDRKIKMAYVVAAIFVCLVFVGASINYNIKNQRKLVVGENDSIFMGEVKNIDDINGISRFSEHNMNNGSFSVAAFSATNNIGQIMWMGITGSNFNVSPVFEAGEGGIVLDSPNRMNFLVLHDRGFIWRNNPLNDSLLNDTTQTLMHLNREGDLNVTGNLEVGGVVTGSLSLGSTDVNISSDNITYETFYMGLLGEGGTNDDLININGGSIGDVVNIFPLDSGSDITLRDGIGNLDLNGADCALKSLGDKAELRKENGQWHLITCIN